MITLERKGSKVFCGGKELTIVAQATKGPGKEVVKIAGLEGSNGQQWVSLSKLKEGLNEVECQGREVQSMILTEDEKQRIAELEAEIREIKERAKLRKPAKAKRLEDMSIEELEAYIAARKGL